MTSQDYIDQRLSSLWEKEGAFFAFNDQQFNDQSKPGVKYSHLGVGLICPSANVDAVLSGMNKIMDDSRKKTLAEDSPETIIREILYNHECLHTLDFNIAFEQLKPFNLPKELIDKVIEEELLKV